MLLETGYRSKRLCHFCSATDTVLCIDILFFASYAFECLSGGMQLERAWKTLTKKHEEPKKADPKSSWEVGPLCKSEENEKRNEKESKTEQTTRTGVATKRRPGESVSFETKRKRSENGFWKKSAAAFRQKDFSKNQTQAAGIWASDPLLKSPGLKPFKYQSLEELPWYEKWSRLWER